ncbi:MAG: zinc ribbon domain-containing protein [Candidatus Helarchaeota archaeon]
MEEQNVGLSGIQSELCCIILAAVVLILQYYVYGEITIWSIYMVIIIVFFVLTSVYNRISIRRRVYSHILNFANNTVPIQNIMNDLHLGFFDVMFVLQDIQNKKKLPIEIVERTGEVVVGQIKGKTKAATDHPSEISSKTIEKEIPKAKDSGKIEKYKCTNCGREVPAKYKYCPSCGHPTKKNE